MTFKIEVADKVAKYVKPTWMPSEHEEFRCETGAVSVVLMVKTSLETYGTGRQIGL